MFEITSKEKIAAKEYEIWVKAPQVASHAKPGQFVVIRTSHNGERIPLTIADFNVEKGEIRLIFQAVGKTTYEMATMKVGDSLQDIAGPLGRPSEIKKYGTVLMIGGGVGIAAILPILKTLKDAGNKVITILGGRSADLVILKDECEKHSDELIVTTDDGSMGMKGVVTDGMKVLAKRGEKIDHAWSIGPTVMMKFSAYTAKDLGIPIFVSLNPIMVDGTGMCGACRVTVGKNIRFACVDGPEFDGYEVNWDEVMNRLRQYKDQEKISLENYMAKVGDLSWL
ncbi:MAG: sulfide/dihydroorotate dehydrogenase-like FAD/NAD-binding protein [Thermotogae bacterium]|jgi:NAD(P)H-flavin reductase|nr:sulfide/dihydroorotate dehydrogenase-like FAD/NAD-binding protein [Thermotogota bacterium]MCL5033428.1 sulfide/dihydroorotate dehydrogenase-like FAD/NAD-binding protein [Thermotogota bacterium]